jgi:hypothetical protein
MRRAVIWIALAILIVALMWLYWNFVGWQQ